MGALLRLRITAIRVVRRCLGPPVMVGEFGRWEPNGVVQWPESRRIVRVEWHGQGKGRWYAWCDGSMTAIPADEIVLEQ